MSIFPRLDPNLQVSHPGVSAGTKPRFHSQLAKVWALFQHPARRSIFFMTTIYTFIHWGCVGPSRHPPSLLPTIQVQLDSQSSETVCRCLLILVASIQWLSWCVWERKSHTSLIQWARASDGFLSSPEHAALERKQLSRCKASGAFVGRNGIIWDIWGKSYMFCRGGISFFTAVLAKQALPPRLKTTYVGDLFQKTILVSGPV